MISSWRSIKFSPGHIALGMVPGLVDCDPCLVIGCCRNGETLSGCWETRTNGCHVLSSWIESPNKGIFRCRESVVFILKFVFFLISFYHFFYQSTNFHSALHSAWWPSHPSHIGAEPHGLAPGLWSNMVGHGKKNENYRCVHWFFEDQTFSILFPDNVCWMFDKNTLRSGNQPTFL